MQILSEAFTVSIGPLKIGIKLYFFSYPSIKTSVLGCSKEASH